MTDMHAVRAPRMRRSDNDLVPTRLVVAMFALMIGTVALVAFAQITGQPNVGALVEAPVVAERSVILTGDRAKIYTATDAVTGDVIALSSDEMSGFIGVVGLVIKRNRITQGLAIDTPVRVVRRDNGHTAVIDDSTGLVVELIGYGADNVAVFARMVD